MKKIILFIFLCTLSLGVVFSVSAKTTNPNANENGQIPEESGDYPVPGRPELRVRVFVHGQNARKPRPTPPPAICLDPGSEALVGSAGWRFPAGNVFYTLNLNSAPLSVRGAVSSFVADSFAKWSSAISSGLAPTLLPQGTTSKTRYAFDGENIIAWGNTSRSTLGVTYVWYYTSTHEVAEVDTIMNARIPWDAVCSSTSYNAENIMIHELGHWYGLDDEYADSYRDNTMYGYGSTAETKKITPENGDFAGISLIYQ